MTEPLKANELPDCWIQEPRPLTSVWRDQRPFRKEGLEQRHDICVY